MQTHLPSYASLFGNIDFKSGDNARSVYSPAAYLTDLLQMLDDEFVPGSIDLNDRRGDLKSIPLDAENTATLIPYLDVVNEVLEGRINEATEAVYAALERANYPFNMPFSLDQAKLNNHLHHLGISAHELRRLFATSTDSVTIAREYLGLSTAEWAAVVEGPTEATAIARAYGYTGPAFATDMAAITTFMEKTGLSAEALRELLYQHLYIDPTDHAIVEAGREHFYINDGVSLRRGYITLNEDETRLEWRYLFPNPADTPTVPLNWFARASRFIRLAQKVGLSFTELDHILRHCCLVKGIPVINNDTLIQIAQVVYIHKTLEQPIATVVALLSEVSYLGKTNEKLPQDQFNQIFNLPCVSVNEQYLHVADVMGKIPPQYADTTYHTYQAIAYQADLFSDENSVYRQRLRHSLGFSDTDLQNITQRLEWEAVADSSLWQDPANQWQLLNVLYRIRVLCDVLDVNFPELFTLFDLLGQDPFIGQRDPQTYFVYHPPSTQKCFEILMAGAYSSDHVVLYRDRDYGGISQKLSPDRYDLEALRNIIGNDTVSSIRVPDGWTVTLYQHFRFQGRTQQFTTDTPLVSDFDDITSSVVVEGPAINIGDRLWLMESLMALTTWMKEFGYTAEGLWQIVNAAPMTDAAATTQKAEDLALYNTLLQSFKATELEPDTFKTVLNDDRAARFAYRLVKGHCDHLHGSHDDQESSPLLLAYNAREIRNLTADFIQQLATISADEFTGLPLGNKLQEKIINNLVNQQLLDGNGTLLLDSLPDRQLPPLSSFTLEYDFTDLETSVFDLLHQIYQEDAASRPNEDDPVEVQIFKSDLKELGLSEAEARQLYDDLMFNGYIDEQGFALEAEQFREAEGASDFALTTGLAAVTPAVHQLLQRQLDQFTASQIQISPQMFADLGLSETALADLITNLQMNHYLDDQFYLKDNLRLLAESPKTMFLALQFYPYRETIFNLLKGAIATAQRQQLQLDQAKLSKITAAAASHWVYEDLQGDYLDGYQLLPAAAAFFQAEENREQFTLRPYFEATKAALVFDHLAALVQYADTYRLSDAQLTALDFTADEIRELRYALTTMGVLDADGLLAATQIPFFLVPENAAVFNVPAFGDYDTEIFFLLHAIAQALDGTVKAVDQALKDDSEAQQTALLEQLQGALGISVDAVKAVSAAIFKTDKNLHFAWLRPLLQAANVLGRLDELPSDMHYTQAVKRIRQLALLINQQQLDLHEIALLLKDQDLVAKFPEDLILPAGVTAIDALLATDEFIYIFKDDHFWIYLAADYTLIDKKQLVSGLAEDEALRDRQKRDRDQQKRLKADPIRKLFTQYAIAKVDAAFRDRDGTWVVISDGYHYVKYADTPLWDRRENRFGQVDNDFDSLEMIDATYVDGEGRLFLFSNDQYVRYSQVHFVLDPERQADAVQPTVDPGYPKLIAEDWQTENLPIQLPASFARDLGPMFDGLDGHSYAFLEDRYTSSADGLVHPIAEMWGHSEYDFGEADHLDAAVELEGSYLFFLEDKVVKYAGSIELANLIPESGYPKALHQEFLGLPDEFVSGIDAALHGLDDRLYLFRDDDFVTLAPESDIPLVTETRTFWGLVENTIADSGQVDAAFVGLDGYTYLFSGNQYVRYSTQNYTQVDAGFPRRIADDWEGLTRVTGAFVLGNRTYLFGTNREEQNIYVRYSTLRTQEDDYLEVDEHDPHARVLATVLANRPDVDEIEVFPASINDDFWSLPESLTRGEANFQIDAVMNGPNGRVYLFAGDYFVEHDHTSRWWSEPKRLADQCDRPIIGLAEGDRIVAAFTGTDGKTYLFYRSKYLRFSDPELRNLDNGFPRSTQRFWGKVRNNLEATGRVDAALVVESRWEEPDERGQLVDRTAMHTYLFSGDQFFRYVGTPYGTVEPGYPRTLDRLAEEPRFQGLPITLTDGIDAAFADQRQVYLFTGNRFHVIAHPEENAKQYTDELFGQVQAVTQEWGINYVLQGDRWHQLNHLEDQHLRSILAAPRLAQAAEDQLEEPISAVLRGTDGKRYLFAGSQYYDVDLQRSFAIADTWGRSRNPIHDQGTIDAAFVGRDGVTYVFSGEWFVQYDTATYVQQTVTHPPRRISDKWRGLSQVALAYVWEEDTYLFERPGADGTFRYLRYTSDTYVRPAPGYPRDGDDTLWNIPEAYQAEGFDQVDAIFVHDDTLIFISDQRFISFNLNTQNWGHPQPLTLLYGDIPFNYTDFKTLKSGFIGADGTTYLFSDHSYVRRDPTAETWTAVIPIKDDWGWQTNRLGQGVDAAWVSPAGTTYLFAHDRYVRYSDRDYRYIDAGYPKSIANDLKDEPAFAFLPDEFLEHLESLETTFTAEEPFAFFNGLLDNGRCLYFFTRDTLFAVSPSTYVVYEMDGLGHVDNAFTAGGYVDAAFVDTENSQTYLFSGEQYIRYTGDRYRYIDPGYPKLIGESLAQDLGLENLDEIYRDGIDAALYLSHLGLVLFNERRYLNVLATGDDTLSLSTAGDINTVWGHLDNGFTNAADPTIDGAYVDSDGTLHLFKGPQLVCYSDPTHLFAPNPYDEPRYIDAEYPRYINEIWPQLDASILTAEGVNTIFQFEDEIYFHTGNHFVTYNLDLSDHDERQPTQILAYRWGEWSDYLLSDIHAISRFKALSQTFTGGDLTLTELVSGAKGTVAEPYMHFAAIFGFEKEEVRWLKQRNAFLPAAVNPIEEDFQLELVLRLYDILATTRRLRVDVKTLYQKVWLPLYGAERPDVKAAAQGAYDVLVAIDCDPNYATLVRQITDEINTLKRDNLVPYVIANDPEVTSDRQLYQKLLIDTQMASCAETSRIVEATAAIQLYLHRYFLNLETITLDASDQQLTRQVLKERWQWLRNYRVWEANRKVFLYPENYIRPELRDTKTTAFRTLEENLAQGELTPTHVENAYLKYLNTFTEVSELTIAGGYIYDDTSTSTNDKKLVLFGRTRTDPNRYYYRFGAFINGESAAATWSPWEPLGIEIASTRVEPVFAFNRLFVFWAGVKEGSDNPTSAVVTTSGPSNNQTVSTTNKIDYEVQIYYSFYTLDKTWTQAQRLQTTFNNQSRLKFSHRIYNVELFVENSAKLTQNIDSVQHDYENIYIGVHSRPESFTPAPAAFPHYQAFNLTPELYSQVADYRPVAHRGQALFKALFPDEFPTDRGIETDNVVMLNYNDNSVDGPWFAYNHKGCGFLVKPDAIALPSDTSLQPLSALAPVPHRGVTAAVQVFDGGKVYYFLANQTYMTVSANGETASEPQPINSRWGIQATSVMQTSGNVDSAFVLNGSSYLTLNNQIYEYDGASFTTLISEPYPLSRLIPELPNEWQKIDAAFTATINNAEVRFWFNNATGQVLRSGTQRLMPIRNRFGLTREGQALGPFVAAAVFNNALYVLRGDSYTVHAADGTVTRYEDLKVKSFLGTVFGRAIENVQGQGHQLTGLIAVDGGLWTLSDSGKGNFVKDGVVQPPPAPLNTDNNALALVAGVGYTSPDGTVHHLAFYARQLNPNNLPADTLARAWSNHQASDFGVFRHPLLFQTGFEDSQTQIFPGVNAVFYKPEVRVTGAFTTASGNHIVIVTSNNAYHLFDSYETPEEILTKLRTGAHQGSLTDFYSSICLGTTITNMIWQDNQVDAAFVGTGSLGNEQALYLFRGDQYVRFSPNNRGEFAAIADLGYPQTLSTNDEGFPQWSQLDAAFTSPDADASGRYVSYLFNNRAQEYYRSDTEAISTTVDIWGVVSLTKLQTSQRVDAAYVSGNYLYLIVDREYYRYTLQSIPANGEPGTIPRYVDAGYPLTYQNLLRSIDAALVLNHYVYLFSGNEYYRLGRSVHESIALGVATRIAGSWGNLPADIRLGGLDAAFQQVDARGKRTLYLIRGDRYIDYEISNPKAAYPYEVDTVMYEVVRLTSSTAEQLNQLLFAGGIKALLQRSTQKIDEAPTISFGPSTPSNLTMNQGRFRTEPTNSHLDFNSANGLYYWEVFFHAPFLIAQALNTDQRFEEAKTWYEHIFDPTETTDYWKFLPFLAADPDALMVALEGDLGIFETLATHDTLVNRAQLEQALGTYHSTFLASLAQKAEREPTFAIAQLKTVKLAQAAASDLAAQLAPYQAVFLGQQKLDDLEADLTEEAAKLAQIAAWPSFTTLTYAVSQLNITAGNSDQVNLRLVTWQHTLQEVLAIVAKLPDRIDLMSNYNAQLAVYLDDPFDPHAIAALRTIAYRKAIVMRYIDNLLDWGDMLFRQYTRESIHEARMLYLLAYDLLGEKPQNLGRVVLSATKTYNDFAHFTDANEVDHDFLISLENSAINGMIAPEQNLSFAATQFDTVTNSYFFIKENELFTEYWNRVEDRLVKIRACLNIDGIAQPLPLFQAPINPMALVNAAASGAGIAVAVAAGGVVTVPDHRFEVVMAKARELVGKLKSFSENLLSLLEKKDAEELSLLQSKQEAMMLELITLLKTQQLYEAKLSFDNLIETKKRAEQQRDHYRRLINAEFLHEEKVQIDLMAAGAALHGVVTLGRIISGLSYVFPQVTLGPFSFGVTTGGRDIGAMLGQFGEATQAAAEGLSMGGEVAGVIAQFKRSKDDWELQEKMAISEVTQIELQMNAQECRIRMAEQELLMHQKDIDNHHAIAQFMTSKFSNLELYSWMSGKLAGLFFQTYKLAHDYAKQAEQAFIFEKGLMAGSVNYLTGMYWDSQRQGLMAGATLELDLDRLEKGYADHDSRRLEITKNISLLEMDPLALLALKTQGACIFRLSEELFDYDFPGHYNRQIKAVSLAFDIGEGQSVNATLTQLSSKLVMDTDIKAVKHLMDPTSEPTVNVRADWRANQQIALSYVDQYTENSGMFELNFGDDRYLPFEGTGAVSTWRLELNGKKGSYNPSDLLDVTMKLRYTAKQGGSRFANEVKGLLKPYHATSFFDLAYNFPDEWTALIAGELDAMPLALTPAMFPNMSSSKIIGLLIRYQYADGNGGPTFTINNELAVPNNTYLQPSTLSVSQAGSEWQLSLEGDRSTLQNAEMILVYKAKV